jgi:hypothetical protein
MNKSISNAPKKTSYLVVANFCLPTPLATWCSARGVKYNTIQTRIWRAGLSLSATGVVYLYPDGEHKDLLRGKVKRRGRTSKA